MKENTMLQVFALDNTETVRHIDEVTRGLSCECVCPVCDESVVAKQGDIRGWHFAHSSGSDCDGAGESALHLAAKQILVQEKGLMLPEVSVTIEHQLADGRRGKATVKRPEMWADFLAVNTESTFGDIRPDVVAYLADSMLFIEIAVTHYIDEMKADKIDKMGVPTLEIDISEMINERLDWQVLKKLVVDELVNKTWIEQLGGNSLEIEARELAINDALSKDMPQSEKSNTKAPEYRFVVEGRRVYVREYPFGLTVWFHYDDKVLNTIKPIIKGLGGSYRKLYKNWLLVRPEFTRHFSDSENTVVHTH